MINTVSILIPVYNERQTLFELLTRVKNASIGSWQKEIVIVDDGSTDDTVEVLRQISEPGIKIFFHKQNMGKGAAIKTGITQASGDLILIQDADLEYDPRDYLELLAPFENSNTQAVYGYRLQAGYRKYYLGNKVFTFFVNLLFGSNLRDPYTGFKVIKTDLFRSLNLINNGFEIEAEITSKLLKRKIAIAQVPIQYYPRTFEKGKKIRFFKDGVRGLWTFVKYRLFW